MSLLQDVRYTLRTLRKSPGFTAVAVITLALGIGANTAIFSLLDAVLLQSLPVRDPGSLYLLKWTANHEPTIHNNSGFEDCYDDGSHAPASGCSFSYPLYQTLRSQTKLFANVTAFAGPAQLVLSGNGPAATVGGRLVSGDFFQTFGVRAAVGRTLGPADDTASAEPAVVLGYAYWQSAFASSPSAIGKTIHLNRVPFTIVGVADPGFTRLSPGRTQDLFVTLSAATRLGIGWVASPLGEPTSWWLEVVGRIRPDVKAATVVAGATLAARNELLHGATPESKPGDDPTIRLIPAQKGLTGIREMVATPLYVLMLAVGLILLIACANVAGLMLARAAVRQRELAVRLTLGAGRGRLIRQLLTESVLVSVIGGGFGVWLAYWGARALYQFIATGLGSAGQQLGIDLRPDGQVLSFTIAITLLTAILFGLLPALRSTRVDLTPSLKQGAGGATLAAHAGSRRFGLGGALVVFQVALSILVLIGAGLTVRTLVNLKDLNPGFETRNLLLFGLDPGPSGYKDTENLSGHKDLQIQGLYRDLETRFRSLPGVTSVSYSSSALLSGSLWGTRVRVDGGRKEVEDIDMLAVSPRFFETMRIPLLAGRTLSDADFAASPARAVVNRAFVRHFFGSRNPLGVHFGGDDPKAEKYEIVGVVADAKYDDLRTDIKPTAYVPLTTGGAYFELRTAGNPSALIAIVRRIVTERAKDVPMFDVRTQSEQIDALLFNERLVANLSSLFGLLALVLACVGLYGLLSYEVSRRVREIGIRMALGAERRELLRMVVGDGLRLSIVGMAIGVAGAFALTRLIASLLFGVGALDPLTFAGVAALLVSVALAASYIPARRAARVDPMVALRYE